MAWATFGGVRPASRDVVLQGDVVARGPQALPAHAGDGGGGCGSRLDSGEIAALLD